MNLTIPLPLLYHKEIWNFKNMKAECIQKAIFNFDWSKISVIWILMESLNSSQKL